MPKYDVAQEAYVNNTCLFDQVDRIIHKGIDRSFKHLLDLHKKRIDFRQYEQTGPKKTISDFYLSKDGFVCFDVMDDLVYNQRKKSYHMSKFYLKPLTAEDFSNNPSIFRHLPMVIVDGYRCVWDYQITAYSGRFSVKLAYTKHFFNEGTHTVAVLLIPDAKYYKVKCTDASISAFGKSGSIEFMGNSTSDLKAPSRYTGGFASISATGKDGTPLYSPITVDGVPKIAVVGANYKHGGTLSGMKYEIDGAKWTEFSGAKQGWVHYFTSTWMVNPSSPVTELIPDKNLYSIDPPVLFRTGDEIITDVVFLQGDIERGPSDWVPTPLFDRRGGAKPAVLHKLPIPPENLFVLKCHGDNWFTFVPSHEIELSYPIFYTGKFKFNASEKYRLYYFYHEMDSDAVYTNHYEPFFRWLKNLGQNPYDVISELSNTVGIYADTKIRSVFLKMLQFDYKSLPVYSELDYKQVTANKAKPAMEYKLDRAKEILRSDASLMQEYIEEQSRENYTVYSWWGGGKPLTLSALSSDVGEGYAIFKITNPRSLKRHLRVFVDGRFIENAVHINEGFSDILYIPADKVTTTSFVEVEALPSCDFISTPFALLSNTDSVRFAVDRGYVDIMPSVEDLYVMPATKNPSETPRIEYNPKIRIKDACVKAMSVFNITTTYNGKQVDVTEQPYAKLGDFTLRLKDLSYMNTSLMLVVKKVAKSFLYTVSEATDSLSIEMDPEFFYAIDSKRVRVFTNGTLMSPNDFVVVDEPGKSMLFLAGDYNEGDNIFVDVLPFSYDEVVHADIDNTMYSTVSGLSKIKVLDFRNVPNGLVGNIPFSLRTHDIFIGKVKANVNNIIQLSPWHWAFKSTTSNPTIRIYAKERASEYFYFEKSVENLDELNEPNYLTPPFTFGEMSGALSAKEYAKIVSDLIAEQKDRHIYNVSNIQDAGGAAPLPVMPAVYRLMLMTDAQIRFNQLILSCSDGTSEFSTGVYFKTNSDEIFT